MSEIVDRMLEDPCNMLNEKDVEALRGVDEGTLKRFIFSMQTQQKSVQNEAADSEDDDAAAVEELQDALDTTQKNLVKLIETEKEIRSALDDYGVKTNSVIPHSVSVANQKGSPRPEDLSPETVMQWVRFSTHPMAVQLREGLVALKNSRQRAVDVIIRNSNNQYTESDLKHMSIRDMEKLANVLEVRNQQYSQDLLSWEGLGLADQSVNQTQAFRAASGGVLDLPTGATTYPSNR